MVGILSTHLREGRNPPDVDLLDVIAQGITDGTDMDCTTKDQAAAVLKALREAGYIRDWRSIESAPKDGTVLDLWSSRGFRYPDAAWDTVEYGKLPDFSDEVMGWTDKNSHGSIEGGGPYTHWMLPPEGPK